MVTLRERGVSPSMAIDAGVWPNPAARRGTLSTYKFRVREERKKVIRISSAKYRKIEDHENGLRRFVLIRNTLRRLQREAREEKLARHRALAANVSPSYLSASRPRSPSPPCDMQVSDVLSVYAQPTPTPISALEEDDPLPSPKRPRLFFDDDKENSSCESRLECDFEGKDDSRMAVDDTQEIFRELYETYTGESLSQTTTTTSSSSPSTRPGTPTPPRPDTPYTASYSCTLPSTTPSLAATNSTSNNSNNNSNNNCSNSSLSTSTTSSGNNSSSSYYDWTRPQQQQQYACGHASLLGNDLQSVVFHSLIASLES